MPTGVYDRKKAGGGPSPEKVEKARALDEAITENASGGATGAREIMGGQPDLPGVESAAAEPGVAKKRVYKGRRSKAEIEAERRKAAEVPPDPLIVALLGQLTAGVVVIAKGAGWSEPRSAQLKDGKLEFTFEAWREEVAKCQIALYQKYCPNLMQEYAAEITLGILVVPWVFENVVRTIRGRRARAVENNPGHDRDRKNDPNEKTDGARSSASNPSGHDAGPRVSELGRTSPVI